MAWRAVPTSYVHCRRILAACRLSLGTPIGGVSDAQAVFRRRSARGSSPMINVSISSPACRALSLFRSSEARWFVYHGAAIPPTSLVVSTAFPRVLWEAILIISQFSAASMINRNRERRHDALASTGPGNLHDLSLMKERTILSLVGRDVSQHRLSSICLLEIHS